MADDLDLLTTPVARGKSLVRKLRKEMSRDAKRPQSGRPYLAMNRASGSRTPYSSGVDEPLPLRVYGSQKPLPHQVTAETDADGLVTTSGRRRRNHRNYPRANEDSAEAMELQQPARSGNQAGSLVHGKPRQYGALQPLSDQQGSQNSSFAQINRSQLNLSQPSPRQLPGPETGSNQAPETSFRSVRWSGLENDDRQIVADGLRSDRYRQQDSDQLWTIDRTTYFVYGSASRANNPPEEAPGCCGWWDEMWAPYGGFRRITSPWIFATLALLFIANVFFMVAFVTNSWGVLHVVRVTNPTSSQIEHNGFDLNKTQLKINETSYLDWIRNVWNEVPNPVYYVSPINDSVDNVKDTVAAELEMSDNVERLHHHVVNRMKVSGEKEEFWRFGLWQCCRNTDNLCLGPRFSVFYGVTRSFAVLSLFLMILSFAWLLGHTLEKLLDYDTCTMSCLISMCYISAIFTTVAVICFGVKWPKEFGEEYDGTDPELSYSFYMAAMSIPFTLGAAVCSTIDLKTGQDFMREQEEFFADPDNFSEQSMVDLPTDNISRPRREKKRRTGQLPYLFESHA